jgi:hypothetical protein
MSITNLFVKYNELTWNIPIERRITIVRGDSGIGKTTMVNYIQADSRQMTSNKLIVECNLNIKIVSLDSWEYMLKDESFTDTLFIFDDVADTRTLKFAQLVQKSADRGNYFLLINREDLTVGEYGCLNIAVSSILRFVTSPDGLQHYTEPYFELYKHSADTIECTDILIEDTAGGKKFFDRLFGKEIIHSSQHGKSSISDDALDILSGNGAYLLILADMSAFGCHMNDLYDRVLTKYKNRVYIDSKYECFEELLLRTKYFKDNPIVLNQFSNIEAYANKFISWETYFEELLETLTKDKNGIQYYHGGNIKTCWVQDCDSCTVGKHTNCDKIALNKDKIDWLLEGTKYEKLLTLRDNMENNKDDEQSD